MLVSLLRSLLVSYWILILGLVETTTTSMSLCERKQDQNDQLDQNVTGLSLVRKRRPTLKKFRRESFTMAESVQQARKPGIGARVYDP